MMTKFVGPTKVMVECGSCLEVFTTLKKQVEGNVVQCVSCGHYHTVETDVDDKGNTFWYLGYHSKLNNIGE